MDRYVPPPHTVVDTMPGITRIALAEFGGDYASSEVANIRVRGRIVIQVVAPETTTSNASDTERFRVAVRHLARTSRHLRGQSGITISYAFDPAGAVPESVSRA